MSSSNFPSKTSRLSENYGLETFKEMRKQYKEMISTLPKRESEYPFFDSCQYEGFWYNSSFLESALCMQQNFKAQPSDNFLCSAPKTATWRNALTFSITTRHDDFTNSPLLNKLPQECIPCLELAFLSNPKFVDAELPLLSTHLPYTLLPISILESDNCKIIYICREPKDTFVSWWHFTQKIKAKLSTKVSLVTLDQAFKWFCQGKSGYGPYWDHVLGYWKASVERPERVFFFKYEDLKEDTLGYVKKLADFMDKPLSKEEEELGVPQEIVSLCSFESLSNLEVNKSEKYAQETLPGVSNSLFFRKGEIGDWKNYLTKDMAKFIDDKTLEKFKSSGLTFASSVK
ncbi:cytosolic sulfotransferase 18-like [Solanum tuberosum]|uniref:cytosolic sulfotransferase 18-like n=1 Tax=Solanum tuberosum TaxID=4113 RepID=UPI00073A1DFB|nr:PREDICTED: cytosolic sulfotransferase 18-like [Solanum tuberosum]